MWEGYKLMAKERVSVENKRYDTEIFPLYSSYTGGTVKELQVDSRQNVLRNSKLWLLAVGVVLLFGWGFYTILGFFNGARAKVGDGRSEPGKTVSAFPRAAPGSIPKTNSPLSDGPQVSSAWRLVGTLQAQVKHFVVIEGQGGRIRLEHPSAFMSAGAAMVDEVDGQRITTWSGTQPAAGSKP